MRQKCINCENNFCIIPPPSSAKNSWKLPPRRQSSEAASFAESCHHGYCDSSNSIGWWLELPSDVLDNVTQHNRLHTPFILVVHSCLTFTGHFPWLRHLSDNSLTFAHARNTHFKRKEKPWEGRQPLGAMDCIGSATTTVRYVAEAVSRHLHPENLEPHWPSASAEARCVPADRNSGGTHKVRANTWE